MGLLNRLEGYQNSMNYGADTLSAGSSYSDFEKVAFFGVEPYENAEDIPGRENLDKEGEDIVNFVTNEYNASKYTYETASESALSGEDVGDIEELLGINIKESQKPYSEKFDEPVLSDEHVNYLTGKTDTKDLYDRVDNRIGKLVGWIDKLQNSVKKERLLERVDGIIDRVDRLQEYIHSYLTGQDYSFA